jgi:thiol-disulfide isomerase/thioredoxin
VDLDGKTHKLSELRGRNVLMTFWATWCPHCKVELPQLGQLRNDFKADELAILAITVINPRNTEEAIRQYVQGQTSINYPIVAAQAESLPEPLNQVEFLPCSFFVNPKGEVKLVTEGLVPVNDMKSILRAR